MINRRGFLFGLSALVASPAVVRADVLMKIKPLSNLWVYDANTCVWAQDSSAIKITDKMIQQNYDVFDLPDIWTNPDEMVSRPNPWLDVIADRVRNGTATKLMADHALGVVKLDPVKPDSQFTGLFGVRDPDRAMRDDMAVGGYNLHERGQPIEIDASYHQWMDHMYKWEIKERAKGNIDWSTCPKRDDYGDAAPMKIYPAF